MHRLPDELLVAAVIEFALLPIHGFLLIDPFLWHGVRSERSKATLRELDHCQSVLALRHLDPKVFSDPQEKGLSTLTRRPAPLPGGAVIGPPLGPAWPQPS